MGGTDSGGYGDGEMSVHKSRRGEGGAVGGGSGE